MKHLKEVNLTYYCHLRVAASNSFKLFKASVALLIHGLMPFLFVKTASTLVKEVQKNFPK